MRNTLLMSAALLAGSMTIGYAQTTSGQNTSGQSPPSPGASSQSVQPPNSLPPGGSTMSTTGRGIRPLAPAAPMAATPMTAAPPSTDSGSGMATPPAGMRGHRMSAHPHYAHRARMGRNAPDAVDPENPGGGRAPADQYTGVPPTGAYQGGAGSPYSNRASNISGSDTRSLIAPRLPNPDAGGNTPQAYLAAADRALARGQTGAAQEALERAQTRILTRSTDPSEADRPDDSGLARAIGDARQALAGRDPGRARSIIAQVLNRGG
jgi:hypothetical protein